MIAPMDLERMLDKCRKGQWKVDQLDWSVTPRPMSRDEEITVVQYFTDMAAIERLAKALFEEQRRRTRDPILQKIFSTFVADEERHAQAAQRLADHYDLHRYKQYSINPALLRFRPHFLHAIQFLSAEIANVYITAGELMLDVALLRSIDDMVDDDMSKQAMHLINRDESRHIAIDYYMVEYYASPAYQEDLKAQPPVPLSRRLHAAWAFANVLYYAKPFFVGVFLEPMQRADPSGRRLREAIKRLQLLSNKPGVSDRPFNRFISGLRKTYQMPVAGKLFGQIISRAAGAPGEFLIDLYSHEEAARARHMSFDELAKDALHAKYIH